MASFRNEYCTGVMFARDETDRVVGYQGYAIRRGSRVKGGDHGREAIGPVVPIGVDEAAAYREAREHVRAWSAS